MAATHHSREGQDSEGLASSRVQSLHHPPLRRLAAILTLHVHGLLLIFLHDYLLSQRWESGWGEPHPIHWSGRELIPIATSPKLATGPHTKATHSTRPAQSNRVSPRGEERRGEETKGLLPPYLPQVTWTTSVRPLTCIG